MSKFLSTAFCALFAVSLVAGGAQAATIYQKDGFTYKLSGDLQIQLRQDNGADQDLDVEYDDLEIKNSVSYELNDNLKAFGELDFGFKDAADKKADPAIEEAYVGLQFYTVKVLMGLTDTAADGFGIYGGIESYGDDDAFDAKGNTKSDDLIMVKGSFDNFNFVVSTELEGESEASAETDFASSVEARADYSVSGFTIGVGYQAVDMGDFAADDIDIMGVSVSYSRDMFTVAADYSVADDGSNDYSVINIGGSVKVDAFTVGVGYKIEDDDAAVDEIAGYYANLQYKFPAAKNVKLFAEVGGTDEEDNDDLGYLAGLQVKF